MGTDGGLVCFFSFNSGSGSLISFFLPRRLGFFLSPST